MTLIASRFYTRVAGNYQVLSDIQPGDLDPTGASADSPLLFCGIRLILGLIIREPCQIALV